jgi:O-antigen/teichoic acid export membrane protein
MAGSTLSQAIPIAVSPILTRIYTPEDFGIFSLYLSFATLFSQGATFRYEMALMLPKRDENAVNILFLCLFSNCIITIITLIFIFIFNDTFVSFSGNTKISHWLYFIPLSVFLTGIFQTLNYWSNRKKRYKLIAKNSVYKSSTAACVNFSIGSYTQGCSGLIFGNLSSQIIANFIFLYNFYKKDFFILKFIRKSRVICLAKKYKKLPLINLPNVLLDGVRLSGINVLITKYFTSSVLGQFSLAWKLLQIPTRLIGSSLSQVFFQKIATADKSDLYRIVKKFLYKTSLISFPVFFIIYLISPELFVLIFGEKWRIAGETASIMSPWLFLNFMTSPLAQVFVILNKHEIIFLISLLYMLTVFAILIFFHHLGFISVFKIMNFFISSILIFFIILILFYTHKEKK